MPLRKRARSSADKMRGPERASDDAVSIDGVSLGGVAFGAGTPLAPIGAGGGIAAGETGRGTSTGTGTGTVTPADADAGMGTATDAGAAKAEATGVDKGAEAASAGTVPTSRCIGHAFVTRPSFSDTYSIVSASPSSRTR